MNIELVSQRVPGPIERPAVLFVHGAFHGAWCWERFYMPFLGAHGWESHALSLRGHGGSDGADMIKNWRLADYVADVVKVLDRLAKPVVIVGHSMGGVIAQEVWRKEPKRVVGQGLLASSPLRPDPHVVKRIARQHPISFLLGNLFSSPTLLRRAMFPFFLSDDAPAEERRWVIEQLSLESPGAMSEVFSRQAPCPRPGDERPTLVIAGREDWSIPLSAHEPLVQAYGADFRVCEGSHDLMLDSRWKDSAEALLGWLNSAAIDPGRG